MITNLELIEQVREIMANTFGVDESDLPEDVSQETFERWTSLYHMTLLMALEEHFGVNLSMQEMTSMTNLAKIVNVLNQHRIGFDESSTEVEVFERTFADGGVDVLNMPHSESTPVITALAQPSGTLNLPRGLEEYTKSPLQTILKVRSWLNAKWQLRKCDSVGPWTRVSGGIYVKNMGEIVIGKRVQIFAHYAHSVFVTFPGGRLEIGDRSVINYGADISATSLVKIGADCKIGIHSSILDNDFHELDDRERRPEGKPVIIKDRVWIANRVTILPGVTIGEDAVIGSGSVVISDIPAGSLVMGNPARVIKKL
jgi:acetyltransferase-like isoleucine patch superfamily enzyme/acyl carrier protein